MEKVDLIVLGATGFTGKLVVEYLIKICKEPENSTLKWGVAGRSVQKLEKLMEELEKKGEDTSKICSIQCDITNTESLKALTKKTKVLLNSTGPYTTLGDQVVQACIETGTHYLDISAELYHMLQIYRKYNKAAKDANVLIISACGFGSIPCVMGLVHLQQQFDGILESVECYAEIDIPKQAHWPGPKKCLVHYGTWASLVHELKNFNEYRDLKQKTFPEPLSTVSVQRRSFFHRNNGKLWFPYPGPDHDIIEMTQRYIAQEKNQSPCNFAIYTTMPKKVHFLAVPAFLLYYYASYCRWFRHLLWKYPRVFTLGYMSHKGPSEKMMKNTRFCFMLHGKGKAKTDKDFGNAPDKSMTLKVQGTDCYEITAISFVLSAITVLKDQETMPKGGVITTGAAFLNTRLIERLIKNGIQFEIIEK